MRRLPMPERPDWREIADRQGFTFLTPDAEPYWDESAAYAFTLRQVEDDLEAPSAELHGLCLAVLDRIVGDERALRRLRVPPLAWDAIRDSWRQRDPSLYGRFDLAYDGQGPAKLLEYNADTPTALYETALFQWEWLEALIARGALPVGADQFNSVHDRLVARWPAVARGWPVHLVWMGEEAEDRGTVAYLAECARAAGLAATAGPIERLGLAADGRFTDGADRPVALLFKLYPWEWIWTDPFGPHVARTSTAFVEPPWKALLANKAFLALLWEAEPGHPNLLPTFIEGEPAAARAGSSFVRKPIFGREGANVGVVRRGAEKAGDPGPYGAEGFVRQALAPLWTDGSRTAVLGSWIVGEEAAGLCVRESDGPITTNRSRFLPHVILD